MGDHASAALPRKRDFLESFGRRLRPVDRREPRVEEEPVVLQELAIVRRLPDDVLDE